MKVYFLIKKYDNLYHLMIKGETGEPRRWTSTTYYQTIKTYISNDEFRKYNVGTFLRSPPNPFDNFNKELLKLNLKDFKYLGDY